MTKDEIKKELKKRAHAELARRSLTHFTSYVFPGYEMTAQQGGIPVHSRIIDVLEKVERGEIRRLMVFCPPRLGKSTLVSKLLPAWYLGRNPDRNVIVSSYGADLANEFGRKTKQLVTSEEFKDAFPDFSLSDDKREGGNWETSKGGGMYTVGVGGAITGKGADLLIVDDPTKNREDAESQTIQQKTVDWYTSTFYTRKQSENSAIIVMLTRWNVNDLAGYLLKEKESGEGDDWHILKIQAIDDEGNEIVWPGKWSEGFMANERRNISPKDWAALYQQDPVESSSNVFKLSDLRRYLMSDFERADAVLRKEDLKCVLYVDPAWSSSSKSDDAAVVVMGKHRITGNYYLIDGYADTSAPSKTYAAILAMYDKALMDGFKIPSIDVESVSLSKDQSSFIEGLKEYLKECGKYVPVNEIPAAWMGKKEDRIKFILEPRVSVNAVHLRADAPDKRFNDKLERQMSEFPHGKHDDVLDVVAMAVRRLDVKWEVSAPTDRVFVNRMTGKVETSRNDRRWMFGL